MIAFTFALVPTFVKGVMASRTLAVTTVADGESVVHLALELRGMRQSDALRRAGANVVILDGPEVLESESL